MEKSSDEGLKSRGLVLVSGLPGCGKSTIIQSLVENSDCEKVYVISFDKIERLLKKNIKFDLQDAYSLETTQKGLNDHINDKVTFLDKFLESLLGENKKKEADHNKEFDSEAWKQSRSICYEITSTLLDFHKNLNSSFQIFLDDNFLLKSMRKPYYILAYKHKIGYCEVFLMASLEICLQRNKSRKEIDQVPEEIIRDSFSKLEPTQYPNHMVSITNDDDLTKELIETILSQTNEKLKAQVEYTDEKELNELKQKEAEMTRSNFIHQLDLKIRGLINTLAKANKDELLTLFPSGKITDPSKIKASMAFLSDFKNYFIECVSSSFNSEKIKAEEFLQTVKKQKFFKGIKREFDSRKINFEEFHTPLLEKVKDMSQESMKNEKSYELYTNVYIEQIHNILSN